MTERENRFHRCGIYITHRLVGSDYCQTCRREIREREALDAARPAPRFKAKELTPRDAVPP